MPSEQYSYDAVHNRRSSQHQPGAWVYNDNDELLRFGLGTEQTALSYDLNGSIIKEERGETVARTREFEYDADDRLTEVKDNGVTVARYRYDALGRRIWREAGGAITLFLYSDEGLIGEYHASGAPIREYGWLPQRIAGTSPIWQRDASGTHLIHTDSISASVALTDATSEAFSGAGVTWRAQRESFGRTEVSDSSTTTHLLRLPGQWEDSATGLFQNHFRDYHPELGRYLSQDPIGLAGGINLFGYANQSPLVFIDPFGLMASQDYQYWYDGFFDFVQDATGGAEVPDWLVNASAGFGDGLTFGLTDYLREQMGINGVVDKTSCAYALGNAAGSALSGGVAGYAAGRAAGALASRFGRGAKADMPKVQSDHPCNCFAAGTLVLTDEGWKPIEDIEVGDRVASRDEVTGETSYQEVTQLIGNPEKDLLRLSLTDVSGTLDELLVTTEHPFMTPEGWIEAGKLKAGDVIESFDGRTLQVVALEDRGERGRTYNFSVANTQTYFVGALGAWVHNTGPCVRPPGGG